MGCDIHLFVEGKRSVKGEVKWVSGDYFSKNPYFGAFEGEPEYKVTHLYDDRDYRLFSILADVRNYTGIIPIDGPRGVPEDSCQDIKEQYEYWGSDAHSASYFTLAELEAYASKKIKTKYSGLVHESEVEKPLRGESPSMWCQGTNQPGFVHMEWEVEENLLEPIIKGLRSRAQSVFNCWTDEQINEFADRIRIVFWFDN